MKNRPNRVCFILAVISALFAARPAVADCSSSPVGPDGAASCTVSVPSGYTLKLCGLRATACGIQLTYNDTNVCEPGLQQSMEELQTAMALACRCAAMLEEPRAKAPSLFQPGVTETVNPFRGVTSQTLTAASDAISCYGSVSDAAKPADVNRLQLLDALSSERSVKPLDGIADYSVMQLPAISVIEYQRYASVLFQCAVGTAQLESNFRGVPVPCVTFVELFSMFALPGIRAAITAVQEIVDEAVRVVAEVQFLLQDLSPKLAALPAPTPWNAFLSAASNESWDLFCEDPAACYSGLLMQSWAELQQIAQNLTGQHAAITSLQQFNATVGDVLKQLRAVSCTSARKLSDVSFRKNAMARALWSVLDAQGVSRSDVVSVDFFQMGPKVLSDIVVQLSGLPLLEQLKLPIFALQSGMAKLQADVFVATAEYQARLAGALRIVSRNQDRILAMLSSSGTRTCSDGSIARQCPVNKCVAGQETDQQGNPTGSLCAAGQRCISDGCNNCEPLCVPPPPSPADSTSSLEILASWLDLLRSNKDLLTKADDVKEMVPKLTSALDFLAVQGTSPGDRPMMFDSGLLTYNRQLRLTGSIPCKQGTARKCFKYRRWTACGTSPIVKACRVNEVHQLPNEFIPWVSVHAGLAPVMSRTLDQLTLYYHPPLALPACS